MNNISSVDEILKIIFDSLCEAAALNPDPLEEGHDESQGEGELIYNIDEVNLGAQQASMLAHLESCFQEPLQDVDGRYNDVEEEDEDEGDTLQPPKKK